MIIVTDVNAGEEVILSYQLTIDLEVQMITLYSYVGSPLGYYIDGHPCALLWRANFIMQLYFFSSSILGI